MIRAILACDDEMGIGRNGDLPWPHNPADLKWFKETTVGDTVVMGKNTWDSLPVKPLPKRTNIVVTRQNSGVTGSFLYVSRDKLEELLLKKDNNIWIIGGAQLLDSVLHLVEEIHLSRIRGKHDCDTFLPVSRIEEMFTLTDSGLRGDVYIDIYSKR